ncbi:MAG: glycine betaine ABC transporter substrate-binding protein [Oscillospiraceae bacterium]|jgi:osmoprotectant transport system permease protein
MSAILIGLEQHLAITLASVGLSTVIGVLLGILISKKRALSKPVLMIADIAQTIPSLALLAILMILFGIGDKTVVIGLVIYSLMPIIQNTYIGITSISPSVKEAAKGMGMSPLQSLVRVELPLALPVIFTGIQIAFVTILGTAVIGVLVGSGGLGYLIYSSIQSQDWNMIFKATLPIMALALLPQLFKYLDDKLKQRFTGNRRPVLVKLRVSALLLLAALIIPLFVVSENQNRVVIGSSYFTENKLLAEMLAQLVENDSDIEVERKFNMEGSPICLEALKSGQIDVYPEYTGTALLELLKLPPDNDPDRVYNKVKTVYDEKFDLLWLDPFGYNNTYAMAVTEEMAEKYNLRSVSDLVPYADEMVFGAEHTFYNRSDGYEAMADAYGLNFSSALKLDVSIKYLALSQGRIQVTDAFTTDGQIQWLHLRVLEDDKRFFPPYYAAPVVREDTLEKHPELQGILNKLSGALDEETMQELNFKVDNEKMSVETVAREFLKEKGFVR